MDRLIRTKMVFGEDKVLKLHDKSVLVLGLGGVGGYCVEGLLRGGITHLGIVDGDSVDYTNLNRQIIATEKTVGMRKVEALKERILSINSEAIVDTYDMVYSRDTADEIDFSKYDYIADCVDMVSAKILIIEKAKEAGVKVISSMGTGNKIQGTKFCVADIKDTHTCPLARVMRRELKKRNIEDVKVVYSNEEPYIGFRGEDPRLPGSTSFVPPVAGFLMAGEILKDLMEIE